MRFSEGTSGFDFKAFVKQLEQLFETADQTGVSYQTEKGDDAYTTLMEQLGLGSFIKEGSS